jgi:hypothetical protein
MSWVGLDCVDSLVRYIIKYFWLIFIFIKEQKYYDIKFYNFMSTIDVC